MAEAAKAKGTPNQHFRIPSDRWERFGERTRAAGTDRSAALRAFVDWYLGDDDALPPRDAER
jgi:hypothetical protein